MATMQDKSNPLQHSKLRAQAGLRLRDSVAFLNEDDKANDKRFRTLYAQDPNFKQLGKKYPEFGTFLNYNGQLNFTDPAAFMQLTKTLLKNDFNLEISLPDDRLCPPVPNRHNYILWLKDLLDSTHYDYPGDVCYGLDIGTGASCIYPLLGCSQRPWKFIATDIDQKSLDYAKKNVEANDLSHRIQLLARDPKDPLIPADKFERPYYDFVMTNPPFYESEQEIIASAENKDLPPSSACTGAPHEMICEGGEYAFVGRIIDESLQLRNKVRWYTAMIGKGSNLVFLVDRLKANRIHNWAVTEFVQGSKTRRWGIAWSFHDKIPDEATRCNLTDFKVKARPRVVPDLVWPIDPAGKLQKRGIPIMIAVASYVDAIDARMKGLDLVQWDWSEELQRGVGRAAVKAWTSKHRKQYPNGYYFSKPASPAEMAERLASVRLSFSISVEEAEQGPTLLVRWIQGCGPQMFEGFKSYLGPVLEEVRQQLKKSRD